MVETFGAVAKDWVTTLRMPARVYADCDQHPGVKRIACEPCEADRLVRETEARIAEAETTANAACDTRFPLRYRAATATNPDVVEWVEQFHHDPATCPNLLLLGLVGVGKTYLGYGALRAAVTKPRPVRSGEYLTPRWTAMTFADLIASLRPRPNVETEDVLASYTRANLLLVDDLGMAKGTEWVEEVTYRLVNVRYENMRPTIFTSNLGPAELRDSLGDRIASRLAESSIRVVVQGPDRRRLRAA